MKKYILLILASLVFVLWANIYFRSFPVDFPQLANFARANVMQGIYLETARDVDAKYPAFSIPAKEKLIKSLVAQKRRNNALAIDQQIRNEYLRLKAPLQDSTGQTYLMELDCWNWARYTENVLLYGHQGDKVINGKSQDSLMLAPRGSTLNWCNFLFYSSAYLYKFFRIFNPIPINTFLFYIPLFYIAVFIAVLYFLCLNYFGNVAAIISCLFVGLAPIVLPRTCAGWYDMDILSLLFPLAITWTYLSAYNDLSPRARFLRVFFASFLLGLFCFSWPSWWFILGIIAIYELFSFLHLILGYFQYKEECLKSLKQRFKNILLFLIFGTFWIIVLCDWEPLIAIFSEVKGALVLNKSFIDSIWPNVYSTVQELGRSNFDIITKLVGGRFLFLAALFSMLILFLRTRFFRQNKFQHEFILFMVIWFFAMFFACYKGTRFIMFLLIPLGISLGWLIDESLVYFNEKRKIVVVVILILAFSLLFTLINKAFVTAKNIYPLINDTWYDLLTTIKEKTPTDSIINSWWDFGDWFKSIARRQVIFDGQSQNNPQAYWMAKVLLENNEERAVGILKMLNNSGNMAFETIDKHFRNPFASAFIVDNYINQPDNARQVLAKLLPPSVSREVMEMMFTKPKRKAYFIVDASMQDKIFAISYLGNWDFFKAYLLQNKKANLKKPIVDIYTRLGLSKQEAESLYQEASFLPENLSSSWVSHQVRFYDRFVKGKEKDGSVLFDNGLVYDPKKQTVSLFSQQGGYKIPRSLFIFKDGAVEEISYPNSDLNVSVFIQKTGQGYRAIALDPQLGRSLFLRLYFLEGAGLKHFKPFLKANDGDDYIRVFEIIWD